jgi:L-asparaginase II
MVAGEGRFDTDLMVAAGGRVLAKAGAEACYAAAIVDQGIGIALKIEDGGARAAPPAVVETLRQLGALAEPDVDALGEHARPIVRNYRGEIVGEGCVDFSLH